MKGLQISRSIRTILTAVVVTFVVTAVIVGGAAVLIADKFDLFGARTIDRSGATLLERIRTLEKFQAAEASFIQDIDIESDTRFVPSFISGERVVAIVNGSVSATVDFSELDKSSVKVDEETDTITVERPAAKLETAVVDAESIRVIDRDRGAVTRLGDVFSENPTDDSGLFTAAKDKMDRAAAESDLLDKASDNTVRWLTTFLGAAGFDNVHVEWR